MADGMCASRTATATAPQTAQPRSSREFDGPYRGAPVRMEQSDRVSAALEEILRDDLNVDPRRVTRDSRLIDDVGLDSVAFAAGRMAIEAKLGVALSEQDVLSCQTVGDLEAVI